MIGVSRGFSHQSPVFMFISHLGNLPPLLIIVILVSTPNVVKAQSFDFSL